MNKIPTNIKVVMAAMFLFAGLIVASIFLNARNVTSLGANITKILEGSENAERQKNSSGAGNIIPCSDIDKDGLCDSEEPLYRTDPLNPDTDGDGFLDGEEIASGCIPTSSDPDDCSSIIKNIQSNKSFTQELSELITGGLLAGDLKPDSPNFSKSILALTEKSFRESQLLLTVNDSEIDSFSIEANSIQAQQEYINNLAELVEKYISLDLVIIKSAPNEEQLFNFYFTKNLESIKKLNEEASQLSVPLSWIEFHKDFLKFLKKSEIFYQNLVNYQKDPFKALLALNNTDSLQKDYKDIISNALQNINKQNLKSPSGSILYFLSNP